MFFPASFQDDGFEDQHEKTAEKIGMRENRHQL